MGDEAAETPFFETKTGKIVGGVGAGLGYFLGSRDSDAPGEGVKLGYQGEIPDYSLVREQVLDAHDPSMLPGARGKRYFSDFRYMPMGGESALAGIAGVRQDLFDQANVGPDSLRAGNYARQGVSDRLPDLGDRGPTGINTVVGAPFDYSQRGLASGESTTYTMADVDDPSKTQYFRDGTVYVPDYGFVNVNDAASIAGLTTGYLAPGYTDALEAGAAGEEPPAGGEEDPGTGGEEPPATPPSLGVNPGTGREYTQAIIDKNFTSLDPAWDLNNNGQVDPPEWANRQLALSDEHFTTGWGANITNQQTLFDALTQGITTLTGQHKTDLAAKIARIWPKGRPTALDTIDATTSGAAQGGLVSLMGGGYLSGATDGMADKLNTTIDNTQPAALSDGEFVVAADVVSHLGNGNSGAGAEQLYAMMDEIRMDRTGTKDQGRQINPNQYMPRGLA